MEGDGAEWRALCESCSWLVGARCDGRQAVPEVKELCQKVMEPALQAPRRPDSDDLAHQQPEIEGTAVDQHPFEDVLVTAKVRASHAAGSVEMSEGSLHPFSSEAVQTLTSCPAASPTVRVHQATALGVAPPSPTTTVGFGYVRTQPRSVQLLENRSGVVTLVANHFLQASGMASTGPLLNALDLSLGVLERLAQRARVALVRALDRHRHDRPRRQVHGLLGFVGQTGTTILHVADPVKPQFSDQPSS